MAITKLLKSASKGAGKLLSNIRKPASNAVKLGSSAVASKPATKGTATALKSAAKSFPTKFAVKGLGGAAVLTGIGGVTKIGWDWTEDIRGAVGLTTSKEQADAVLDQAARGQEITEDQFAAQKDWINFLDDKGLLNGNADLAGLGSNIYGMAGSGLPTEEDQGGSGILPVVLIGGGVVAAIMIANNLSKKTPKKVKS